MNRKIFTLLLGALMLVSSVFTVNAQRTVPYTPKVAADEVNFEDILSAELLTRMPADYQNSYFLLSVTGIANTQFSNQITQDLAATLARNFNRPDSTLVLSIDSMGVEDRYLRLEFLAKLDTIHRYKFVDSYKFGALRNSLWCLNYRINGVDGSNMVYDFQQMNTGVFLLAPSFYDRNTASDPSNTHVWSTAHDNNQYFANAINTLDPRMMIGGWHFSQTYTSTQPLQQNMPLYSYVSIDTVAVLVLTENASYNEPGPTSINFNRTGGYTVSVKHVAVSDLIRDAIGNVNTDPTWRPIVENVLLFSLKKVNKFVMNANDWNSVRWGITMTPDANVTVTNLNRQNKYTNLLYAEEFTPLFAYEVNDSLYHYGYMQFEKTRNLATVTATGASTAGNFLYVDTAWVNIGNSQYLPFGWGKRRDSTNFSGSLSYKWGQDFSPQFLTCRPSTINGLLDKDIYLAACADIPGGDVYWRLDSIIWAIFDTITGRLGGSFVNHSAPTPNNFQYSGPGGSISFPGTGAGGISDKYDEIYAEYVALGGNPNGLPTSIAWTGPTIGDGDFANFIWGGPSGFTGLATATISQHFNLYRTSSYTAQRRMYDSYSSDSARFILVYMKDSIMENQSKFRVVYDPTADSTFINVYQSRVQYPDYSLGSHNATYPPWWTNSFDERTWVTTGTADLSSFDGETFITRPSDAYTQTPYGIAPGPNPVSIERAAWEYKQNYINPLPFSSNVFGNYTHADANTDTWYVEGHGTGNANGTRVSTWNTTTSSIFNFHSFMEFYPQSTIPGIDRVLISTADTVNIFNEFYTPTWNTTTSTWDLTTANFGALAHTYGWSLTNDRLLTYRDSLLYIDIQSINYDNSRIVTLNQSFKNGAVGLNTRIRIKFGEKCEPDPNGPVTMENDLYLIRNTLGQYLTVPLWSITDSIYWVTPEANEDLTKIPAYQWAVMTIRKSPGSPFRLVNREFENVEIPLMYVFKDPSPFLISGRFSNASFNTRDVTAGTTPIAKALAWGSIPPADFSDNVEALFPLEEFTFIRLGTDVKNNQLLGYKYIDKDATYIDVYAFKFLHWQRQNQRVFLSWEGYDLNATERDTVLYARGEDYYDKLFFNLQEMTDDDIWPDYTNATNRFNGRMVLTDDNTNAANKSNWEFRPLYLQLARKPHVYTNADRIVLERFGFWEATTGIADLKPMARQAYRLFLQDYYRWHPTQKGHYVTVGGQDRYVLSDKANATKPYQKGNGSAVNLFGVPFFYFRETYFDVYAKGDDYFAMIQRIDTMRADITNSNYFEWGGAHYGDIQDYLTIVYGSNVAKKVLDQIRLNREFGLALLDIDPGWLRAKFVIRGDAANNTNISAFQLERDDDPIYRRFHKNEPNERFGGDLWDTDLPDTLEFHIVNQGEQGLKLFENSGNYLDADQSDLFGADGGRIYNRDKDGRGDYFTDTLGHVISFLGMNNTEDFPNTNRAFFLDTAYINRGTGWIKPQYLLAVDPYNPIENGDCDPELGSWTDAPNKPYVLARYLYNASQYAKAVKSRVEQPGLLNYLITDDWYRINNTDSVYWFSSANFNKVEPIEKTILRKPNGAAYVYDGSWERLAFAWAIHIGDSLIVLKGPALEPGYMKDWAHDPQRVYAQLVKDYGGTIGKQVYIDFPKFLKDNIVPGGSYKEAYFPLGDRSANSPKVVTYNTYRTIAELVKAGKGIGIHAIIDLADNTHKDWVFSFRYFERGASDFVIESETGDRDTRNAAIIRPGYGGWVKNSNGVPVISRSDEKDNMGQVGGMPMNVKQLTNPVGNERVLKANNAVEVIGGNGFVTILNAAGKKVVVSNMLGQTVANVTLTSDNASIPAPAGVIVVSVEKEKASKVIVK